MYLTLSFLPLAWPDRALIKASSRASVPAASGGIKWDQLEGLPAGAGSVGPRTAGRQLRRRAIMTKARGMEHRGPGGGRE